MYLHRCYECDCEVVPGKNKNQVIRECQAVVEKVRRIKQAKMRGNETSSRAIPCVCPQDVFAKALTHSPLALSRLSRDPEEDQRIKQHCRRFNYSHHRETQGKSVYPRATESWQHLLLQLCRPGEYDVSCTKLESVGTVTRCLCHFLTLLQVLVESRSLRSILSENEKEKLVFPTSPASSTDAGLGPLTTHFKGFLNTMWKQRGGTVAPQGLFMQIARKWKMFRRYQQQDSHELMRHLFDGMKQEEMDMIKRRLSEEKAKEDGTTTDEQGASTEVSKVVQGLPISGVSEKEPGYVPFIDSCFSGRLVSVIVCDACKKVRGEMRQSNGKHKCGQYGAIDLEFYLLMFSIVFICSGKFL